MSQFNISIEDMQTGAANVASSLNDTEEYILSAANVDTSKMTYAQ
jgi:hypothetical protein